MEKSKGTQLSRKERKRARTPEEKLKRKKRRRIIWLSIIGALVVFRLILPYIVLKYVNKKLANLEEYYGHVDDIDLHLYRGAYEIKKIRIVKKVDKGSKVDTIPFFKSPSIDLSVEWSAIFDGAIVGEISVEKPVINFVKDKHKGEDVKADTADFATLVDELMPITINRFDIHNGEIHYRDLEAKPKLDLALKNINITATNLTNVTDSKDVLPATLKATAEAYEGKFYLTAKFDGLAKVPTFDMSTEVRKVNLVLLNDMLREYANFDLKRGTFSLYGEFAAKKGKFGGYVKPFVENLDIVQWNKEEGDFRQILYETFVGSAAELLQNQRTEQLATKLPINGTFSDPNVNIWHAISYVLRNAFFNALHPTLDNTININRLKDGDKKTFLEKVFTGDPEKKKPEKKNDQNAKMKGRKNDKNSMEDYHCDTVIGNNWFDRFSTYTEEKVLNLILPEMTEITLIKAEIRNDTAFVEVSAVVENKAPYPMNIDSIVCDLSLGGTKLISTSQFVGVHQKPGEFDTVTFAVNIPIKYTQNKIKSLQDQDSTGIAIHATIVYSDFKLNISKGKKIEVPVPPKLRVMKTERRDLSIRNKNVQVDLFLEITNDGKNLSLDIRDLQYELTLGDDLHTEGKYGKDVVIRPYSSLVLKFPLDFEMNHPLATIGKVWTDNDRVPIRIKLSGYLDVGKMKRIPVVVFASGYTELVNEEKKKAQKKAEKEAEKRLETKGGK